MGHDDNERNKLHQNTSRQQGVLSSTYNDEPIIKPDNPYLKEEAKPRSTIEIYHYDIDQLGKPNELTDQNSKAI